MFIFQLGFLHFTNTASITDNPLELFYTLLCFCTVCSCVFKDLLHNILANVFYFSCSCDIDATLSVCFSAEH